ncbi:hypothetical protein Ccrd_024193 [Cynara cardunculus var. scolymus]|uniref:THUMP domain-containing protein n=1 Tax=Cynara cardunculus var. scolymus TaxID=59895 RepID=A0A103XCV0_CYNCS|nr:hypothetical protein Ccrd_024193 [Cynara cardunculus var. scolymus]
MAEFEVAEETTDKKIRKDDSPGEMKPWEQHSAVISIPRYDYKAPTSMLHRSFAGFLVTCPIKREKSATKEAMSILYKYVGSINTCSSEGEEDPQNVVPKRRKVVVSEAKEECTKHTENKILDETTGAKEVSEGSCLSSSKSDANIERSDPLSLVKLTKSGLLLLTFSCGHCPDVVDIVSNIMQSLESGSLKAPLWCHRILPIQTTCVLHEKELCTLTESKGANGNSNPVAMLDRSKCFEVVAAAVKSIVSDSVVDLKCPELSVLIELLPISQLPKGSSHVVAVSVLPRNLIMTKPRLCIKALVPDTKSKK